MKTISDYISSGIEYMEQLVDISTINVRLVAMTLIVSTFLIFILMTFIFYIKSLFMLVKEAGETSSKPTKEIKSNNEPLLIETSYGKEEVKNDKNPLEIQWGKDEDEDTPVDYIPYNYSIGVIMDMMNRGVTESKIAQAISSRTGEFQTHEQVLQTVHSIKTFISYCKNGKFENIDTKNTLSELAKENIHPSLSAISSYINNRVMNLSLSDKDSLLELSDLSCILGTLSSLENAHSAVKCFEMAIELNQENVIAWSRLADMYNNLSLTNKANWAYRKVLEISEPSIDAQQIANANAMLARYYKDQNIEDESQKLLDESQKFYKDLNIDVELNDEENLILDFIEENQEKNLDATISGLLEV